MHVKSQGLPVDMITPTLFLPALHREAWPAAPELGSSPNMGHRAGYAPYEIREKTGVVRRSEPCGSSIDASDTAAWAHLQMMEDVHD